jgi:hypothetical protein
VDGQKIEKVEKRAKEIDPMEMVVAEEKVGPIV